MKIYFYELYKIAKAKMFGGITAVLLAFSLFVFGVQQNKITGYTEAKDIFENLTEIYSGIPYEEISAEIELKYTEYDIRSMRLRAVNDGTVAMFMAMYEESYPELYEEMMNSDETMSIEELEKMRFAYWQLYENAKYMDDYPNYLYNVQENAKTMTSVSIFAKKIALHITISLKPRKILKRLKG